MIKMVIAYREKLDAKSFAVLRVETFDVSSREQGEAIYEFFEHMVRVTGPGGKIISKRYFGANGAVYE